MVMPSGCPGGDARSPQERTHLRFLGPGSSSWQVCPGGFHTSSGTPNLSVWLWQGPVDTLFPEGTARPGHTSPQSQKHLCADREPWPWADWARDSQIFHFLSHQTLGEDPPWVCAESWDTAPALS